MERILRKSSGFSRLFAVVLLLLLVAAGADAAAQPAPLTLTLKGKPVQHFSGHDSTGPSSDLVGGGRVERWTDVREATVTWYPASSGEAVSPVMLVLPGGGYRVLATDMEGTEVCRWLNSIGVSALLLRYRVPTEPPHTAPLVDAQAALALLNRHAAEWHMDLSRVGVIGFSAGAHLAGRLASVAAPGSLKAMLLIYPAFYAGSGADVAAVPLKSSVPPAFIVQAQDDPIGIVNATTVFDSLTAAKVPAELHIYPSGGHGYGLRPTAAPVTGWPALAGSWLKREGFTR